MFRKRGARTADEQSEKKKEKKGARSVSDYTTWTLVKRKILLKFVSKPCDTQSEQGCLNTRHMCSRYGMGWVRQ